MKAGADSNSYMRMYPYIWRYSRGWPVRPTGNHTRAMTLRRTVAWILLVCAGGLGACEFYPLAKAYVTTVTIPPAPPGLAASRPAEWAQPMSGPGLGNFHRVSDDLYRGEQPTAEGMKRLQAMGIKTVLNLRAFHSDRKALKGTSLEGEHISVKPWHIEDEDVAEFLRIVTDKSRTPVFVHCQHGADRTGLMVAVYRVAVCGWSKDQALEEMVYGGFGFHEEWRNIIQYFRELDVERIRKEAGLTEPSIQPAGK